MSALRAYVLGLGHDGRDGVMVSDAHMVRAGLLPPTWETPRALASPGAKLSAVRDSLHRTANGYAWELQCHDCGRRLTATDRCKLPAHACDQSAEKS